MKELIVKIQKLQEKIQKTWKLLDLDNTETKIKALEYEVNQPDFWKDQEKAKRINQQLAELKEELETWKKIQQEVLELLELARLGEKEHDESVKEEIEKKLSELEKKFAKLEFYILFSQKYDKNHALVAIHAGTGGVDAQDWAEMLLRMILRFCEKRNFSVRILDRSPGNEAGIKRAVVEVSANYAYGWLRSEHGVHRLVRISPFDAEKMRHTSFALIEVLPVIEEVKEVNINDNDLKIETFRSSGHGGQSVNTTDSAVRITHIPTGIVVSCQNERSQLQNRETAMKILRSKLHKLHEMEQQEEKQKIRGEYTQAEWGNQIRSYVLQPYKMVKDLRTRYEDTNPESVLDGNLEGFVEAYLRWSRKEKSFS